MTNIRTPSGSPGLVTAGLIKAGSGGSVTGIFASNLNAAERYLLLFDKATAPVATDVPKFAFPIPPVVSSASGQLKLGRNELGDAGIGGFALGIGWAISSALTVYTVPTPAEHTSLVVVS